VFGPNGRWLASAGAGADRRGEIRLWDASDFRPLRDLYTDAGEVFAVAASPDGR
jgi:hypothetical protein